ncbi:uncharacterized protein LOC127749443 [Frankliniella occidentalis]|uniref:Uncharacterized protein LOC127749443 n=1 Tax=Frankliniella occidentalis TaxID=133901 RepID=A0A9C6TZX6_FRAOC|nr:uncharacterized protein LOC127749443 [Frankliniella occidentalis]
MAADLRPTTTFSGEEFQALVQTSCNIQARHGKTPLSAAQLISDRTTLVRCLEEKANTARRVISADLQVASQGCVGKAATTDLWTEKYTQRHYMSLTMHVIDHNHKLLNLLLSVSKFRDDTESAENLAKHLDRELEKYSIDKEHLVFVTDGGSNIIKALDILKIKRIYCMDHCLNIILRSAFNMKMVDLDFYGEEGEEVFHLAELAIKQVRSARRRKSDNLKRLKKPPEQSTSDFRRYVSRVPCMQDMLANIDEVREFLRDGNEFEVADKLNVDHIKTLVDFIQPLDEMAKPHFNDLSEVDQDWLNNHIADSPEDSEFLRYLKENARVQTAGRHAVQLMERCKKIVTLFKKWGENDLLDETLKQEIPTRWNSMLIMLMSFPKNDFEKVNNILRAHTTPEKDYSYLLLDDEDQWDIKALIKFLKPWKTESERVQGDKYPTLQYVLVAAARLAELSEPRDGEGFKMRHLRARAAQLLEKKFIPDDLHKVAAFLWPDFRRLLMLKTHPERKKVFDLVMKMIEKFNPGDDDVQEQARKRIRLGDGYDRWRAGGMAGPRDDEEHPDEVEAYLEASFPLVEGKDVLKFWEKEAHRFPKLAKLAKEVLCIPASSASSERAFSIAGLIISPRRSLLSAKHLDDMLVIRSYLKYIKQKDGDGRNTLFIRPLFKLDECTPDHISRNRLRNSDTHSQ